MCFFINLLIFIYSFILCICYFRIPFNPLEANFFVLLYGGCCGAGKGSFMRIGVCGEGGKLGYVGTVKITQNQYNEPG